MERRVEWVDTDASGRYHYAFALRQAEAKYRGIFEKAVEGIFQTTLDGHYLSANPALARIYGYTSPDELAASVRDIQRQLYVDAQRRAEFKRLIDRDGSVDFLITSGWSGVHGFHSGRVFILSSGIKKRAR